MVPGCTDKARSEPGYLSGPISDGQQGFGVVQVLRLVDIEKGIVIRMAEGDFHGALIADPLLKTRALV